MMLLKTQIGLVTSEIIVVHYLKFKHLYTTYDATSIPKHIHQRDVLNVYQNTFTYVFLQALFTIRIV